MQNRTLAVSVVRSQIVVRWSTFLTSLEKYRQPSLDRQWLRTKLSRTCIAFCHILSNPVFFQQCCFRSNCLKEECNLLRHTDHIKQTKRSATFRTFTPPKKSILPFETILEQICQRAEPDNFPPENFPILAPVAPPTMRAHRRNQHRQ